MSGREDSYEIYSFAIDFYNDVTGLNVHAEKAWDLQSKGNVAKGSMEIGRELVTLYKNYLSDLTFNYLIFYGWCSGYFQDRQFHEYIWSREHNGKGTEKRPKWSY